MMVTKCISVKARIERKLAPLRSVEDCRSVVCLVGSLLAILTLGDCLGLSCIPSCKQSYFLPTSIKNEMGDCNFY